MVVLFAVMIAVSLIGSVRAVRLWKNQAPEFDGWPVELRRALPAISWLGAIFFISGAVLTLDLDRGHPLVIAGAVIWIVDCLATLVLMFTLPFEGKPQALVPPHLRRGRANAPVPRSQ